MDSTTSLSNDKLAHLLYTAINVLTAVTPVIAAITTIAIITAIIMEFNEDHIEAPPKDLTPSPPSPSPWQHQERDNRPPRR
ncbi:hypothetical protein E4U13_007120 [Claviceps humidiphila]|uniref:Uncharacterized protein n=1 Tax=Claviceps humidiphila TaxID=1294629 RepID=A0A9P7TMN2_9HYPO|nr:hypothetical protein E4U13_007120 [Claviceps humidiphila]